MCSPGWYEHWDFGHQLQQLVEWNVTLKEFCDLRNCLAWVLRTNHKKLVLLHFRKDGWKHSITETSYLATGRDMILFHYPALHDWMHWAFQDSQARWHKHRKKTSARAGRAGPSVSLFACLPSRATGSYKPGNKPVSVSTSAAPTQSYHKTLMSRWTGISWCNRAS